jgi:hypothetical protein
MPDPGSYDEYCIRQHRYASDLTLESPEVLAWIEFANHLPQFPLPLGDASVPCAGEVMTVQLMDERQTARFESACVVAGARFSGGVFACAALAEHELTGVETYYGITLADTRSTPAEFMTMGWFVGLIPITVPVVATSFGDTARAAQVSFDSSKYLANVPVDRVLELVPPELRPMGPQTQPDIPILSYLDTGLGPLSATSHSPFDGMNAGIYTDGRIRAQLDIRVLRLENKTVITVAFPNNPVTRESVTQYIATIKSVYATVSSAVLTSTATEVRVPAETKVMG